MVDALQRRKKVIFRYYDLDIIGKRIYRREGHHYVVEPVALVFNEDNYYIVVYSSKHESTASYRVDRMVDVEVIDDDVSEKFIALRSDIGDYTEQAIKMYGGELQTVGLEFDSKLTGAVYDRFGEDLDMISVDADRIAAAVRVQLSPTFWGWLFQFGRQMRVTSPEEAVAEYKLRIEELSA